MKFYSEKLDKLFDTQELCAEAEEAHEKAEAEKKAKEEELATARKTRAIEVEAAYKASVEATKHYHDLLDKFVKDYGSFHMTVRTGDFNPFDGFDHLFKSLWL